MKSCSVEEFRELLMKESNFNESEAEAFLFSFERSGCEVLEVSISDNKDCPYIGVSYDDDTLWIYGAGTDCEVSADDFVWYLEQEG